MKESPKYLIVAALFGFLAVALGAFGAHGLKSILSSQTLETYKTGIQYHFIHTIILVVLALQSDKKYYKAFWAFTIGIILFSFSLYTYAITGVTFYAMVTPVGGVAFLIGWIFLIISALKK